MNINGGTLEFDMLFNDGQVYRGLETTKKLIKNLSALSKEAGSDVDASYNRMCKSIQIGFEEIGNGIRGNKEEIKGLEKEYRKLSIAASDMKNRGNNEKFLNLENQKAAIQDQIKGAKESVKQFEAEEKALIKLNRELDDQKTKIDNAANAQVRFRTELMNVKQKMMELAQAGKQNTTEYARLTEEAKRLANAMYAANQQVKVLTTVKGATLQGLISGLSGISGAATAAQGAVGLFADKNEELQRIMLKVQSLMSITMGLQAVSATLNQTSAFRLTVLTGIQNAYSTAVFTTGKALIKFGFSANVARFAAQALYGTLTLGLGVAITSITTLITKWVSKSNEAKKAQEELVELEKDARETMFKARIELEQTIKDIKEFTGTKEQEKKKVEELNKKYGETFGYYNSLTEWYNVLIEKSEDYIQMLFLQAKAQSLVNKAMEADNAVNKVRAKGKESYRPLFGDGGKINMLLGGDNKNNTGSDPAELAYNKAIEDAEKLKEGYLKEAEELQNGINKIREKGIGGFEVIVNPKTKEKEKDPYTQMLEDRKKKYAEYLQWVNSKDEIVRNAAKTEFSKLLKGGGSYKEYLNNEISALRTFQKEGKITAEQLKQLHIFTTALQEETKQTIMHEFEKDLQTQLNSARSIMGMLDTIGKKRDALKEDDPLKTQKTEILDKHQEDVAKKAQDDYNAAMKAHSDYLDSKINAEVRYLNKKKELETNIEKEIDADRKAILQQQLDTLNVQHKTEEKTNYDTLLQEYRSFEQKKLDIDKEYEKNKKLLEEKLNSSETSDTEKIRIESSLKGLEKAYEESLSHLSVEILQQSDTWKELFTDIDNLSTSKILELKNKLNEQLNDPKLSKEAKVMIQKQLDDATEHVRNKNPFAALKDALEQYKNDPSSKNLKTLFSGISASIDLVKGSLDAVVNGLKDMGLAGDEETQKLLGDISKMVGAAGDLAMGIATGNPLQIIQGSISLITSAIDVFNAKDRAANREIKRRGEHLKELQKQYDALERAANKALGSNRYSTQKAELENLKKQQEEYNAMAADERGKKKSDSGKVEEYTNAAYENGLKILDLVDKIREDIMGGTSASIANDLGNAFIDAFSAGEDAMGAFKKKADDVVAGIMRKMLIQKLLEQPIGEIIDRYSKKWLDNKGNFIGYDAVMKDADAMGNELKGIGEGFASAMENLPDEIKKYFVGTTGQTNSLSGAIKGITQEQADLLAGQTNAIRVNQVESIEILRNQLLHIVSIDMKIGISNQHLEAIEENTKSRNYDPLRAEGIIN